MRKGDGIYLRGSTWRLDFTHRGKRHQVRLGKGIKRSVAAELAAVERARVLRGEAGIGNKRKDLPFAQAADSYGAWLEANRRPNTVKSFSSHKKELIASFGGKNLSEISPFLVEKHKLRRIAEGAPVALNRELSYLRAIYNKHLAWKKYEGDNPVQSVKQTKESRGRTRWLDHDEEARLLAAAKEPLRTLIVVGIYTGLRIAAEALTLRWENVDLRAGFLTVIGAYSKNGDTESVPLNSIVLDALRRLKAVSGSEFVFTNRFGRPLRSVRSAFTTACRNANLADVTPHTLRHTFGSRLAEAGTRDRVIQDLGRWKEPRMVMRYTHLSDELRREAVEKIAQNSTTVFPTAPEGETRNPLCARSSVG